MVGRRGVKIPYTKIKRGRLFWQPTSEMKKAGFLPKPLGPNNARAQSEAARLYEEWLAVRAGRPPASPIYDGGTKNEVAEVSRSWPRGSIGAAYVEFMRTPEWARLALSTRNRDILPAWSYIRDAWADCDPNKITLSMLSDWRAELVEDKGIGVAHRVFKEWRRHWKVMRALKYVTCEDPSIKVRNDAPPPRNQTWKEGEVVRLVKAAIRSRELRLATTIAVIWDTQFQPGDARTLKAKHLSEHQQLFLFDRTKDGRQKTGVAVIGTLSKRTHRLLSHYLVMRPAMTPEAWLFPLSTERLPTISELSRAFRVLAGKVFPGDKRQLRDMRRSGTVEAFAGGASTADVGTKMGNSIGRSNVLFKTYNPVDLATVKRADEARLAGRIRRRETNR